MLKGKKNPSEVRNVLPNGESKFLRPMPGSARMYPETDLPLLRISREMINHAKKTLPRLISESREELRKKGLSEEYIQMLFKQGKLELFKELSSLTNKPNLIAKIILVFPREIASRKKLSLEKIEKILEDNYGSVLNLLAKRKIKETNIKQILENLVDGKSLSEASKFEKVDLHAIEEQIHKIIKGKPGLSEKAYMGLVMKELKGKISGKEAMDVIRKLMK